MGASYFWSIGQQGRRHITRKGNCDASFSLVFGQNNPKLAIDGAGHEWRKEMRVSKEWNLVTLIALPQGKSVFVHFKHLFSSGSQLAFPPRPQRRSSALEL